MKVKNEAALLALMMGCGSALAQSSVTLSGVVDLGAVYAKGSLSKRTSLQSENTSSRIVFSGREDLGGGYAGFFVLDFGINPDDGTGQVTNTNNQASGGSSAALNGAQGLTVNRRSLVSLVAPWGEIRLGRDYSTTFKNQFILDPWALTGIAASVVLNPGFQGPTAVRVSNMVAYALPAALGGTYGEVQHFLGENLSNAANKDDGTGNAARLGYASGPVNVGLAYVHANYLAGDHKRMNFGASYKIGSFMPMAQIQRDKIGATKGKAWFAGVVADVGNGDIRASYGRYTTETASHPTVSKLSLGYVYRFSKTMLAYTTVARVNNKGGATTALGGATTAANQNSTGFDIGIRKDF